MHISRAELAALLPLSFNYVLDKVGHRTQVTNGSGAVTTYSYDPIYDLLSASNSSGSTTYTYDSFGDRLTMTANGVSITYTYDADDRLLAAGSTTFTYDKDGNRLTQRGSGQTLSYTYDAVNRLVSVTGGTSASSFVYDGDGNRVIQTVGSGSYSYANDLASTTAVVLEESGPDGNIAYAYGIGLISESATGFELFPPPRRAGQRYWVERCIGNVAARIRLRSLGQFHYFGGECRYRKQIPFYG